MSFKIITISREFGSGGRFIGEQIAQKCGIEFYDKKIIEHVAKELGISEQIVANQGEYAPAGSIFSYAFVGRDITGVSLSEPDFQYPAEAHQGYCAKRAMRYCGTLRRLHSF